MPVSDKCILWLGQGSLSLFESGQDLFQDRSELFRVGFRAAVDSLATPFKEQGVDLVVGIESRGFILGGAVADRLGAGFSPVRMTVPSIWFRRGSFISFMPTRRQLSFTFG